MVGVPISTAPHIYVPGWEVREGPQEDPSGRGPWETLGFPPPDRGLPGGVQEFRISRAREFPDSRISPRGGNSGKSVHTPGTPLRGFWHPPKSAIFPRNVGKLVLGPKSDPPGGVQKPPRALAGLSPTFRIKKWSIRGGPPRGDPPSGGPPPGGPPTFPGPPKLGGPPKPHIWGFGQFGARGVYRLKLRLKTGFNSRF